MAPNDQSRADRESVGLALEARGRTGESAVGLSLRRPKPEPAIDAVERVLCIEGFCVRGGGVTTGQERCRPLPSDSRVKRSHETSEQ